MLRLLQSVRTRQALNRRVAAAIYEPNTLRPI
jgi:hypothetical protein